MNHKLKTIPPYFEAVANGQKTFELRKNDRNFQAGDMLTLKEYNPHTDTYSGREVEAQVTYILQGFNGLEFGYCVLGIKVLIEWNKAPQKNIRAVVQLL